MGSLSFLAEVSSLLAVRPVTLIKVGDSGYHREVHTSPTKYEAAWRAGGLRVASEFPAWDLPIAPPFNDQNYLVILTGFTVWRIYLIATYYKMRLIGVNFFTDLKVRGVGILNLITSDAHHSSRPT